VTLQQRVGDQRWYHTLDLPGGVRTPGEYDLRGVSARLPWPGAMAGMRCLDVGSRDGFYAFDMERRGAGEVVSLDLDDPADIDFPGARRPPDAQVALELRDGNEAFALAQEALVSDVRRVHRSVYALTPEAVGRFDFVVVATLLVHLRDPVQALRAVGSVLAPGGRVLINEVVTPGPDLLRRKPVAELIGREGPFWWLANPAGLRQMAEAAGLRVLATGRPYVIPWGEGAAPRASLTSFTRPRTGWLRELATHAGQPHAWLLVDRAEGLQN